MVDLIEGAGVLAAVKDKALPRAGLQPSLTSAARAGHGVSDRDDGMTGTNRTTELGIARASGSHGDSRIEPLTCFEYAEAENQELAHRRDDDLLGFQAARAFQPRDESGDDGIEAHCG